MPDWEYMLHTDIDNDALVSRHYSWLLPGYKAMSGIQRADLARYMYMHQYGGVYVRGWQLISNPTSRYDLFLTVNKFAG